MTRSPVLGFNHNLRHGGCLFHVQTEDGGLPAARIDTHVFLEGRILHTRKQDYDAALPADAVRTLMKRQHKGVLCAVREGELDTLAPVGTLSRTPPAGSPSVPEPPAISVEQTPWQRLSRHLHRARSQALDTVLHVELATREAFLRAYFQGSRADGLFVETEEDVQLGAIVGVDIQVTGVEARRFSLRGRVISRRHRAGNGLRRGVGVEFLQQDSAMKERLLAFMQPELLDDDPREARWVGHPLHAVLRGGKGALGTAEVVEVHVSGATIRVPDSAAAPLRVGDEISVAIRRGRLTAAFSCRAIVVWKALGTPGSAGLEFIHDREESHTRIRGLLAEWRSEAAPRAAA